MLWCPGDGKGLVDSMSSFGVKATIQKSIITEKKNFNDVEKVKIHLQQKHVDKPNWLYKIVSIDQLQGLRIHKRKTFKKKKKIRIHYKA